MPIDEEERFVCTRDDPYTPEKAMPVSGRAIHPMGVRVGSHAGLFGEEFNLFRCPICRTFYSVSDEVPNE